MMAQDGSPIENKWEIQKNLIRLIALLGSHKNLCVVFAIWNKRKHMKIRPTMLLDSQFNSIALRIHLFCIIIHVYIWIWYTTKRKTGKYNPLLHLHPILHLYLCLWNLDEKEERTHLHGPCSSCVVSSVAREELVVACQAAWGCLQTIRSYLILSSIFIQFWSFIWI